MFFVTQPKEKNTLNITRDDLSQALQTCLQSRAEFASFLLPFLIEKLESPAEHVKIDCYRLLHSVCDLYTCNDFAAHYVELWTTIKADALIGGDSPVQTLARSLPQHIARAMLRSVKNDLFIKFIALLRSELEPCLANPLLNCFHTASVVCSHLAVIPSLFAEITLMLTKHFVDQLAVIDDMPSERVIELMKSIDSYCECVAELDWKSLQKNSDGEAFDSIDQLFSALADWMANYSGKRNEFQAYLKAFQRCMSLEVIRPSQECLDVIAHKTVAILALSFQVAPDDRICEELMLQVFATFVRRFPVHAHFHMYPFILRRLNEADWQHSIGILHAVQLCSLDPSQLDRFTNFALTILIRREQVFERVQQAVVDVIRSMRARYPLAQLFEMYVKMVVEALNYLYLTQQADCESGRYLFEAISLIAPYVPVDRGGIAVLRFFVDILYLRTPSDPHLLSETSVELRFDLPQFRTINIFDGSHRQVLFVGLLHASLVRLEFPFNLQLIEQLIDRIRHLLFNSYFVHDHHRRRSDQATLELLESVTAKFVHNPDFERFLLDDQLDELYQEHRETQIVSKCSTFIHIFRSIAKALLHVNHSRAEASLDHLAGLFLLTREPELLFRLVSSFEHAITPADHLTKTAHVLNATEFVVQRFFYSFLPRLLRIYNNLDELLNRTRQLYESTRNERVKRQTLSNMDGIQLATESISLNQVGRIVQAIENRIHSDSTVGSKVQTVTAANDLSTVSQDHIERLNLLRVCLSHCILMPLRFLPNAIVRNELLRLRKFFDQIMLNSQANQPTTFMLTQLHCIRLLFELNPGHLLPQLVAVIHFLTKHLQSSKQAIRVKCLILDCLTLIARTCPEIELLKMRREVICALEPTLDDPKRVVRYASVRTNCRWVLIGQPS